MPEKKIIRCDVDEVGRLPKIYSQGIHETLTLYAGSEVQITIEPAPRTLSQNRYYWAVVLREVKRGMDDAGLHYSTHAWHVHFKHKYLHAEVVEVMGITHVLEPSTTRLNKTEMSDYIERIKQDEDVLAAGITIPEADPLYSQRAEVA